jgi:hypothetical protein
MLVWHSCVEKKDNNMEKSCICPNVMENGWSCMSFNVSS